jgi:methylmalonyl-CoA mutase C-terminal domain/subunit
MGVEKMKVVIAKPGLDGHDRGTKVVARALVEAGMEEEDADVIGLSILSGAHMTHFLRIKKLMDEKGLGDRLLTCGGIIPTADQDKLAARGVGCVFGPGDDPQAIVDYIREWHGGQKS